MSRDDDHRTTDPHAAPREAAPGKPSPATRAGGVPPDRDLAALGPLARGTDREEAATRHACALAAQRAPRQQGGKKVEPPAPARAELTELDAVRATCRAWNTLDLSHLEPLLADTVRSTSQAEFDDPAGKPRVLAHLRRKMQAIAAAPDARVFAEVGETRPYPMAPNPPRPCVVAAQGTPDNVVALTLVTVRGNCITDIDTCYVAPHPSTAWRSGEYPGADSDASSGKGGAR